MTHANEITFGIELETYVPVGTLAIGSYYGGTQAAGLPEGWQAKRDGSLNNPPAGYEGCEFVSPVLKGAEGLKQVLAVVAHLQSIGAKVNASCGMHVHVGFDRSKVKELKQLIHLVANFEKAIFASTGTTARESGRWCKGVQRYGNADRAADSSGHDRYHVLNLENLRSGRRPTVEFRAFAGTLNATKIVGYVRLCVGLVERALKAQRSTDWSAKPVKSTSPIARGGEGQTALTRLFYQLGWTKGRVAHTHGNVDCDGAPSMKEIKKELMRLAKKYDSRA